MCVLEGDMPRAVDRCKWPEPALDTAAENDFARPTLGPELLPNGRPEGLVDARGAGPVAVSQLYLNLKAISFEPASSDTQPLPIRAAYACGERPCRTFN